MTDSKETPALASQKTEDDSKVAEDQSEKSTLLKTDDQGTTEQHLEVRQSEEQPKQVLSDAPKTGKQSLLDLLGDMKVEVTNKRKLKNMKLNYESAPKSKPAAMESTISMFTKATGEASSQRCVGRMTCTLCLEISLLFHILS